MSLPFASLSGATSARPGAARDLEGVARRHTMIVVVTGSPTISVELEGSHDGVSWLALDGVTGALPIQAVTVEQHLVRHVRANIETLTGGTAPTVTVTIASDVEEEE